MRFTLCILVLVLLAVTLAFPDPDGYRKKGKKNKKNKDNTNQEDAEDDKTDEEEDEDITKLRCVNGHVSPTKTVANFCETDLSFNCMKVYAADNPFTLLDTSHFIYTCVKPGLNCKTMYDTYLKNAPEGSYCEECDRKYNGCNAEGQNELYEQAFGGKQVE
ncbi:hypothetical protein ACHWQZ_G006027 [Mnemiopsis leidyi]